MFRHPSQQLREAMEKIASNLWKVPRKDATSGKKVTRRAAEDIAHDLEHFWCLMPLRYETAVLLNMLTGLLCGNAPSGWKSNAAQRLAS